MVKNFKVTVNGKIYDVAVEETAGQATNYSVANEVPVQQAAPVAQAPVAPAPTTSAKPVPVASSGGQKVIAPMPGTILSIKVAIGDKVAKNQPVAILEAMKMENEIVSPVAGVVSSINTTVGSSVSSGDVLVTISE